MGNAHSTRGGSPSYPSKSGRRSFGSRSLHSHSFTAGRTGLDDMPEGLKPQQLDESEKQMREDEQQEFSVSFGYHCRTYFGSYEESSSVVDSQGRTVEERLCSALAVSSAPPSAVPCIRTLVTAPGPGGLTPSCSPPMSDSRKRNSSFSFLSGAAMGANATLANSVLVSSSYSRALLLGLDSPTAFRHIRCPARAQGLSTLGVPQWTGPDVSSEPRSQQHQHQQQQYHKPIGIVSDKPLRHHCPQPEQQRQGSNGIGSFWTLSSSSSYQQDGSSAHSASSSGGSSMSSSAPDLSAPSFMLGGDVQVAGGAAGEDRVQAVCSEENGWLFCGVYDGFNGRDAADFLAANLYEKIGVHLRLLQWASQNGYGMGLGNGGSGASAALEAEECTQKQLSPESACPPGAERPMAAWAKSPPNSASTLSAIQATRSGSPGDAITSPSLDLSFLQPWVLCSCCSSLCECPHNHVQASRLSSPPPLPTVTEDEGSLHQQQKQALQGSRSQREGASVSGMPSACAGECSPRSDQHAAGLDLFQQTVSAGLRQALGHTEKDFFHMVEQEMEERPDLTMVGSCVLVLLIHGSHLFTANLGDSRAVLATWRQMERTGSGSVGSKSSSTGNILGDASLDSSFAAEGIAKVWGSESGCRVSSYSSISDPACLPSASLGGSWDKMEVGEELSPSSVEEGSGEQEAADNGEAVGEGKELKKRLRAVQLTETHCVDYEPERERVAREHPTDPDAVIGRRVKGKLRVTRAFGAGYLKSEKMNNSLMGIFRVKDLESPPYISSEPFIRAHPLHPLDQFVVIGSDGLFDFFSNEEVVDYVSRFLTLNPHGDPAKHMLEQLLVRAADRAGKTVEELKSIPRGKRRKYHDDTTVIVITLGHTFRTSSASTLL